MASCYYTIIWKGADGTLYIPFDGESFDDIELRLSTTGDSIVEIDEFEVHDNFIVIPIESGELDLLPDGVIRYALTIDGVTDAGNLNAVLKTPDGYDGETADDIYQRGYEDGLRDCSGNTGYERGYEDGLRDGLDSGFTAGYQSGYTDGLAACSGDTPSSGDTPTSGDTPSSGDTPVHEVTYMCASANDGYCTACYALDSSIVGNVEYKMDSGDWQILNTEPNGEWDRYAEIEVPTGVHMWLRAENGAYDIHISNEIPPAVVGKWVAILSAGSSE